MNTKSNFASIPSPIKAPRILQASRPPVKAEFASLAPPVFLARRIHRLRFLRRLATMGFLESCIHIYGNHARSFSAYAQS